MNWRNNLSTAGFAAIAATRADQWLRGVARGSGVILTFHRVRPRRLECFAPNRFLEVTPDFLDRVITLLDQDGFDVVPLDEVPARLETNRKPRPFAAITFDDGYRDNLQYAWPILKRHGVPWAIFIVPAFLDRSGRLWWLELEEAIARLNVVAVTIGKTKFVFDTRSLQQKHAAYQHLCRCLKARPEEELLAVTAQLASLIDLDFCRFVGEQCASWDEILALAQDPNVTIGSHTMSHPILYRHDSTFAAREIEESKTIIESQLGRSVRHLAFPFGDRGSVGQREFFLARDAGYLTAVTTRPGHLWTRHARQLTALPRVSINGNFQTEAAMHALLSGVPFLAWPTDCERTVGRMKKCSRRRQPRLSPTGISRDIAI
jgi:peptidoglycan/xylan/chitin deacetylase (PgdA/CDA1 family)